MVVVVVLVVVVVVAVVDGFVAVAVVAVGATAPSILFVDVVPPTTVHSDCNDDEIEDTSSSDAADADI